jgi:hypothetical protein
MQSWELFVIWVFATVVVAAIAKTVFDPR